MNNQALQLNPKQDESLVPADVTPLDLQAALAGDLKRLTPEGRLKYYGALCNMVGLNPLSKPFDWLELQGKLVLYANKGCAEQLRKLHGVSLEVIERKVEFGCLIVRVKARDGDGRQDEALGAVPFNERNAVEAANQMMKCETKAKRRATLSICGLGLLDESELDGVDRRTPQVEVLNGVSAADRAQALNDRLTGIEKEGAIDVEPSQTISGAGPEPTGGDSPKTDPIKSPTPAPSQNVSPAKVEDAPKVMQAAESAPKAKQAAGPAASVVAAPVPAPAIVGGLTGTDGLLTDEVVRNIETVLSEQNQVKAIEYLVLKGKLNPGKSLATLQVEAANFILKKPVRFHQMVADWIKGGSKKP